MSFQAKRELLVQVAPRYREAGHKYKCIILDEFVATTGYARKYAIRLLKNPVSPPIPTRRPRERRYGIDVQEALATAWAAANYICAKRLVPFLPDLVEALERHGHMVLEKGLREQLVAVSPATADRLLRPYRQRDSPRGISTTKPGVLLKHQVPVRTFADWTENVPGFMEADLVAHCGCRAEGAFLYSLVATDVATGWTECLALLYRTQEAVIQAFEHLRYLLPIPLLGIDTDNGSEFLNAALIAYCESEKITFTRRRAYKKNDQCFVEQKNGSIVRQLVGYDRFEGEETYRQMNELYRAVRLYINFFQPSVKLRSRQQYGSRIHRTYDEAQTPFQRLLITGRLDDETEKRLKAIYVALDPVELLRQLESLQDALWRHSVVSVPVSPSDSDSYALPPIPAMVSFNSSVGGDSASRVDGNPAKELVVSPGLSSRRKYRRVSRRRVPHTWRTRSDPFEIVWDEITHWLIESPEMTAKSVLDRLQKQHPGQYPKKQLRTLQRRVKEWRAHALLEFDNRWLSEGQLSGQVLPHPLRALADCNGLALPLGVAGTML